MLFTELSVLYVLFLCIVVYISVSVFFLTTYNWSFIHVIEPSLETVHRYV